MMNAILKKLTSIGTENIEDQDIAARLKTANLSMIMLFFSSMIGGTIAVNYMPQLTLPLIIIITGIVMAYMIVFTGHHLVGRILFVSSFFIGAFLAHLFAISRNEPPLAVFSIITVSSWIIPWSIFSYRKERWALASTMLIGAATLLLVPLFQSVFSKNSVDNTMLKESGFFLIIAFLTLSTNILFSLISAWQTETARKQAKQLITELQESRAASEERNKKLQASLAKLESLQAIEEKRKKGIVYQAELSDVLRAHSHDLEKACDRAISLITRYIEADAGALFLHEEVSGREYLQMIACYANGRRKYISKKFGITEGLVGQVFMEKAYIIANNMPEEHIRISSGLGEREPTHLLLVPMLQNDMAVGVMEFASFRPFDALAVEMAEKLANITASVIVTTRINERTRELLVQSQHQTEDLRAREEEMRQNMEELAATQEEMVRINDELSNKTIAVNILLAMVELGTDKKILSCNDNFIDIMGYSREELLTMTHADLVPFDIYSPQDYELWWASLAEGRIFNGKSIRKTKSGKKITLNCCYRPVFSPANNEVVKIVKYFYPVTIEFS